MDLDNLKAWFDSDEGKKSISDYADKLRREDEIMDKQFERFKRLINFGEFTEKVILKYSSKKYRDRWYNRGIEPPESLYWFLFEYAERYGRKCSRKEWNTYGNVFSSSLYFCNGYYFNRMDGQGSVIKIIKKINY